MAPTLPRGWSQLIDTSRKGCPLSHVSCSAGWQRGSQIVNRVLPGMYTPMGLSNTGRFVVVNDIWDVINGHYHEFLKWQTIYYLKDFWAVCHLKGFRPEGDKRAKKILKVINVCHWGLLYSGGFRGGHSRHVPPLSPADQNFFNFMGFFREYY